MKSTTVGFIAIGLFCALFLFIGFAIGTKYPEETIQPVIQVDCGEELFERMAEIEAIIKKVE